jgi:quercetin dioxygenase-like cupin family protein
MGRTPTDRSVVVSGLAAALPLAASATTSRTLIDNERVRVVAFTFDTGEQLTEHTAAMPVVVQLVTGSLRFEVAGGAHDLTPGDCVYLAAREPHSLEALEPSSMTLVMVREPGD